jgi:hypothetical protein
MEGTDMTTRYTPEQMRNAAICCDDYNDEFNKEQAAMLRQAADDAERLAAAEADAERMANWVVRCAQHVTDHACKKCLPNGEILIGGWECGWHTAERIDAARSGEGG